MYVAYTQKIREQEIKQCLDNNENVLHLTKSPILLMQNYNPREEFFIRIYKMYYNLPENTEIELKSPEIELIISNFLDKK